MVKASSSKSLKKENDSEGSSSFFEKTDLFSSDSLELGAEISKPQVTKGPLSNKICPRCQKPGTGLYSRWVRN